MSGVSPTRRFRWLGPLLAVYWLTLFAGTHVPPVAVPVTTLGDKTEHFIAYGVLGLLLVSWLRLTGRPATRRAAVWIALALAISYAAVDELTQPLVGRACDVRDMLADAVGAAIGTLAGMFVSRGAGRADPV